MANTRKITTPIFRCSYISLLEPKETQNGSHAYSVVMIFEPDADLTELKAIFAEAVQETWKGTPPKTGIKSPFRRGEWKSESYPQGYDLDKHPEYDGKIMATASSYVKLVNGLVPDHLKVGIVGPDPRAIFDPSKEPIYSGMYGRAEISAYVPKDAATKKPRDMVSFTLHNFQKCKDGDPLGGGANTPAEKVFDVFEQPAAAGFHDDLLGI